MKPSRLFYGFLAEPVFDPQTLIAGESLLGWIARTTIENDLPHITTITRDVGQVHRNKFADVMRTGIDVAGLAVILGDSTETIEALRSLDLGAGRARYLGSKLAIGDVHTEQRRFSPAALADDLVPFYRASWLIRTFPVCTSSWHVLRSRCDCGHAQSWSTVSTLTLCENCGHDLRELTSDSVPEHVRPGLQFLADILFGDAAARAGAADRLPPDLRMMDFGDIYELALLTARIVDPSMGNPRENVWRDEPLRLAIALSAAGELLPSWPQTPWLALGPPERRRNLLPRSRPLARLRRVLIREHCQAASADIAATLDAIAAEVSLDGPTPPVHLVDLNEAEKIAHMNKKDLRAARAAGHLGSAFVLRGGDLLPAYDRTQLEEIYARSAWPSASTVGRMLGLPTYGVEQLCAMGELEWAKAPHRILKAGLFVDPVTVDRLVSRLRKGGTILGDGDDGLSLNTVMRGIGGREKPWGPVIVALLSGVWPYATSRKGKAVREIIISTHDVDDMRAMVFDRQDWDAFPFADELDQTDACDILNVSVRSRGRLIGYRKNLRGRSWAFDRQVVTTIAQNVIALPELIACCPAGAAGPFKQITGADLTPTAFGYRREGTPTAVTP